MTNNGFHYHLEPEKIREYRKLSAEDKLKWLEAAFLFSEMALTPKAKRMRTYFRDGIPIEQTQTDGEPHKQVQN